MPEPQKITQPLNVEEYIRQLEEAERVVNQPGSSRGRAARPDLVDLLAGKKQKTTEDIKREGWQKAKNATNVGLAGLDAFLALRSGGKSPKIGSFMSQAEGFLPKIYAGAKEAFSALGKKPVQGALSALNVANTYDESNSEKEGNNGSIPRNALMALLSSKVNPFNKMMPNAGTMKVLGQPVLENLAMLGVGKPFEGKDGVDLSSDHLITEWLSKAALPTMLGIGGNRISADMMDTLERLPRTVAPNSSHTKTPSITPEIDARLQSKNLRAKLDGILGGGATDDDIVNLAEILQNETYRKGSAALFSENYEKGKKLNFRDFLEENLTKMGLPYKSPVPDDPRFQRKNSPEIVQKRLAATKEIIKKWNLATDPQYKEIDEAVKSWKLGPDAESVMVPSEALKLARQKAPRLSMDLDKSTGNFVFNTSPQNRGPGPSLGSSDGSLYDGIAEIDLPSVLSRRPIETQNSIEGAAAAIGGFDEGFVNLLRNKTVFKESFVDSMRTAKQNVPGELNPDDVKALKMFQELPKNAKFVRDLTDPDKLREFNRLFGGSKGAATLARKSVTQHLIDSVDNIRITEDGGAGNTWEMGKLLKKMPPKEFNKLFGDEKMHEKVSDISEAIESAYKFSKKQGLRFDKRDLVFGVMFAGTGLTAAMGVGNSATKWAGFGAAGAMLAAAKYRKNMPQLVEHAMTSNPMWAKMLKEYWKNPEQNQKYARFLTKFSSQWLAENPPEK